MSGELLTAGKAGSRRLWFLCRSQLPARFSVST